MIVGTSSPAISPEARGKKKPIRNERRQPKVTQLSFLQHSFQFRFQLTERLASERNLDRLLTGIGPAHVTRADDSSRGAIIVLDHADVRFGLLEMPCVRACRGMTAMNQADPLQTELKTKSAAAGD